MLISHIEIIEDDIDPSAFVIELVNPYDVNGKPLQRYNFYGFDVNNHYKFLKIDGGNYLFENNMNNYDETTLYAINETLKKLEVYNNENKSYLSIFDKRVSGFYPNAFERTSKFLFLSYLHCISGVLRKDETNSYVKTKIRNISKNFLLYDRLNVFNKIKPYNSSFNIYSLKLSSGDINNPSDTVYPRDADIIFLQYAKIHLQNELVSVFA